jgi:hypothetical protein
MCDPKKGGLPVVVQAVRSTTMFNFNDPEIIQSCAVSRNGCVFIMVAHFTPGEVVRIWMRACNQPEAS